MNNQQRQKQLLEYFTCIGCEQSTFLLKICNRNVTKHDQSVKVCFCGKANCASIPKIIDQGKNNNINQLFFENSDDANIIPDVANIILSKSQLMVAGRGQKINKKIKGVCDVCESSFEDYLEHINLSQHQERCLQNDYHNQIIELSKRFQVKQGKKLRKKDKYANKFGKTRKLKYDMINKKTGKFMRKHQE